MTTPKMCRCKDCSYLAEDKDGKWVCLDCIDKNGNSIEKDIEEIEDEDCSLNQS